MLYSRIYSRGAARSGFDRCIARLMLEISDAHLPPGARMVCVGVVHVRDVHQLHLARNRGAADVACVSIRPLGDLDTLPHNTLS